MSKKATSHPARLIAYPAEVESHRAAYERVGEAFVALDKSRQGTPYDLADIVPPGWAVDEPESYILHGAQEEHMRALFESLLVCIDDDFWRTLYVELRLYYDRAMLNTKGGMYSHRRKGASK